MAEDAKIDSSEVQKQCVAMRTQMAARTVTRLYEEALRPVGLKAGQFTLLMHVYGGAGRSITDLAGQLAMERTTLTRNLAVLEKLGLVAVAPEGDRRTRAITITAAGKAKLDDALPLWRQTQEKVAKVLGTDAVDDTRRMLEQLATLKL